MAKIFDFSSVIDMLLNDNELSEPILKYVEAFGLTGKKMYDIQSYEWYTDYISKFRYIPFHINKKINREYDLKLIQQLSAGTCSYQAYLKPLDSGINHLYVSIKVPESDIVTKEYKEYNISNLLVNQIKRMMCISVSEQLALSLIRLDDSNSLKEVEYIRERCLASWEQNIRAFNKQRFKIIK
ncbi:MAG: hypothetical protein ACQEQF_12850 [Bacillota bacterium]